MPPFIPEELIELAIDLKYLHIYNIAWKFPEILQVIDLFTNNSKIILGGDVFKINEKLEIEFTYDSWYYNRIEGISDSELLKQSREKAIDYIKKYVQRNNDIFYFSLTYK